MWAAPAGAAVIWSEGTNGDLSNVQETPTALALALGTNSIIGNVIGVGDTRDWVTLTVPAGMKLKQITLASYASTDAQGFMGFDAAATFAGDPLDPGSYNGYAHFGTGATNPSIPTNLVGVDILPIMADPAAAAGSKGFSIPLGPGDYAFLIQQLGASTSYQFDYVVVPEPATMILMALGCAGAGAGAAPATSSAIVELAAPADRKHKARLDGGLFLLAARLQLSRLGRAWVRCWSRHKDCACQQAEV
jgi:hypothetical protein